MAKVDIKSESNLSLLKMLKGQPSYAAQTYIVNELIERVEKQSGFGRIDLIKEKLAEIESDDRYKAPPATVTSNAPLALIQTNLESSARTLRWVLKILE